MAMVNGNAPVHLRILDYRCSGHRQRHERQLRFDTLLFHDGNTLDMFVDVSHRRVRDYHCRLEKYLRDERRSVNAAVSTHR